MVERLCVPLIQRLVDAELEAGELGLALERVERSVDLRGVDAVANGRGEGGVVMGRRVAAAGS